MRILDQLVLFWIAFVFCHADPITVRFCVPGNNRLQPSTNIPYNREILLSKNVTMQTVQKNKHHHTNNFHFDLLRYFFRFAGENEFLEMQYTRAVEDSVSLPLSPS